MALSIAPAAANAASFVWTGEAAKGEGKWSNAANWEGGVAPSGAVETLTFPKLAGPECAGATPKATCYLGEDDIGGISAKAIAIDDASPYLISAPFGDGITLGSGGITAKPTVECTGEEPCSGAVFFAPITPGPAQTWSISGSHGAGLSVGEVESEFEHEHELKVSFANNSFLRLEGTFQVGELKASGAGTVEMRFGESLNGEDEQPIKLTKGASLSAPFGSVGPLEASEDSVRVGEGRYEGEAIEKAEAERSIVEVVGPTTLGSGAALTLYSLHPGSAAGIDYSQLYSLGKLHLAAGATLHVLVGEEAVGAKSPCSHLTPGSVETLVESGTAIEGEFTNAPEGAEIKPESCVGEPNGELPPLRIHYTGKAVAATVLESKEERRHREEAEAAARKHAEEEAAARKRAEEEAAARKRAEEEAAARKRAEEEAARKLLEEQLHPTLKIVKIKVTAKGLQITLALSRSGTVTLSAPGCKKASKHLAAGAQHVTLSFTAKGKRERAQRKRVKLSVQLNDGHASVAAAKTVKL
jgi:hypothetical protein